MYCERQPRAGRAALCSSKGTRAGIRSVGRGSCETPDSTCFGEIGLPKHITSANEALSPPPRNIRNRVKPWCVSGLSIWAGRPGWRRRTASGAGATPPKSALACAAGPVEEVAPRIFPCRKAGRARGPLRSSLKRPDSVALRNCDSCRDPGCCCRLYRFTRPRSRPLLHQA